MKDSLITVTKAVGNTANEAIDLINNVDSFYNSAWDKLIIVGSLAFGVIGVIVPLVIQWYQKKTLKISEELLKKDIENQTLKLKSELMTEITQTLETKLKKFEEKIDKDNASHNARTFHLQGNSLHNRGLTSQALGDFIIAARDYSYVEDYSNLRSILNFILEDCLPKLSQEEVMDLKISQNCDLDQVLTDIEKRDDKGVFIQTLRDIRLKLTKIPKLKQP
jgi:hypothetical protein